MKKRRMIILIVVGIALFALSTIVYTWFNSNGVQKGEKNEDLLVEEEDKKQEKREEEKNPFGTLRRQEDLKDADFASYIHKMSHQKVKADQKWGFHEITEDRIDWLLEGLDKAEEVNNKEIYLDILERWKKGDFSKADEDHNEVWGILGGEEGYASRVYTEEEEKQYLEYKRAEEERGF